MFLYYIIILLITILLFGLRYRVGIDTIRYNSFFDSLPSFDKLSLSSLLDYDYSPLFIIFMSLCKFVINEFWLFQLLHSIILNSFVFYFCWKRGFNPFIAVFYYFIIAGVTFNTEILRESMAVGIFLLNYRNIEKKKWFHYYLLSLLSIGFHYSAIITLIIPLFSNIKFNMKLIIYIILYLVIVCLLVNYVEDIIPIDILAKRYQGITTMKEDRDFTFFRYIALFIKSVFFPAMILSYNRKLKLHETYESMLLLFSILSMTAFVYPILFDRLSNYCLVFYVLCISNCVSKLHSKGNGYVFLLLTLLFFMHTNIRENNLYRYYPYHSIFDKGKEQKREKIFNDEIM
ncbi:MAG: EpsG family protein [Prevotella sp.]|nr:EpsG family protein [Prevotella sp.]